MWDSGTPQDASRSSAPAPSVCLIGKTPTCLAHRFYVLFKKNHSWP